MSHVEARAVPQGKQAAGTPLGPSEKRMDGIESWGMRFVCQKSILGCQ